MNIKTLPFHVFLSYSRDDSELAFSIKDELDKKDIQTWIDTQELIAGTPDWEKVIRTAISHAFVVVFISSPSSKKSVYVQAEIALAQNYEVPIIPIWIKGDSWIESTPMSLFQVQYIDFKNNDFDSSMEVLIKTLKTTIAKRKPKHFLIENAFNIYFKLNLSSYLSIWLDDTPWVLGNKERLVLFNPDVYHSLQELFNDLYFYYLKGNYPIVSYGKEWILKEFDNYSASVRLILPLSWLKYDETISVHVCQEHWTSSSLKKNGLIEGTHFVVTNPNKINLSLGYRNNTLKNLAYGVSVSNESLFKETQGYAKQPYLLYLGGFLKPDLLRNDSMRYKYQAVFMDNTEDLEGFLYQSSVKSFKNIILVETDKIFSKEKYERYNCIWDS